MNQGGKGGGVSISSRLWDASVSSSYGSIPEDWPHCIFPKRHRIDDRLGYAAAGTSTRSPSRISAELVSCRDSYSFGCGNVNQYRRSSQTPRIKPEQTLKFSHVAISLPYLSFGFSPWPKQGFLKFLNTSLTLVFDDPFGRWESIGCKSVCDICTVFVQHFCNK